MSRTLLRTLMERTGTGAPISGRELARKVGIPTGTIDALLNGTTRTQPATVAQAIADQLGVALLILWAPRSQPVRLGKHPVRVAAAS